MGWEHNWLLGQLFEGGRHDLIEGLIVITEALCILFLYRIKYILWRIDPMLGNNRETMRQQPLLSSGQRVNGLDGKRCFLWGSRRWLRTQQCLKQ
jgi:hypothetical protein